MYKKNSDPNIVERDLKPCYSYFLIFQDSINEAFYNIGITIKKTYYFDI